MINNNQNLFSQSLGKLMLSTASYTHFNLFLKVMAIRFTKTSFRCFMNHAYVILWQPEQIKLKYF